MPPAERVVAFAFSHDGFRARPPAPFYRLAGPATWDACSIDRTQEDYRDACPKSEGPARLRSGGAGSGCESPTSGAEFPLRDGLFSVWRGLLPLQTACRCVCRGGRIGHVRYRISRHVRYRPGCFDFHAGGSSVGQMAFGLPPAIRGGNEKAASQGSPCERLFVCRASGQCRWQAVESAQLGADGAGRFAVDHAEEQVTN